MKKHIMDEKTGIAYTLHGDYYLPDFTLPKKDDIKISVWGRRHYDWLKKNKAHVYNHLLWTDRLPSYLESIDKDAVAMYESLVTKYAKAEGVDEKLKAKNQMEWVRQMNNISNRAKERVFCELIYK